MQIGNGATFKFHQLTKTYSFSNHIYISGYTFPSVRVSAPLSLIMATKDINRSPSKILSLPPKSIQPGSHTGKVIAVFTSGGDSQGK